MTKISLRVPKLCRLEIGDSVAGKTELARQMLGKFSDFVASGNDRFWRKADIGVTGAEWPVLTQSGHSG